ncbi:MAG: type II toxin-antitoxin system RelE/ParE family toxin [Candidatus Hatepunaea meridiana]|nr:type II toxin-antitoxin system RelE/ParE family toxin [Candidatus Hatepunaea meridiana]
MKLAIFIRPEAEAEIEEAYRWYEKQREGLGNDFLLCVEETLIKIQCTPEIHPIVYRKINRALIRRFPYGVFCLIKGEKIVVLAMFHGRRDPRKWKSRGKNDILRK